MKKVISVCLITVLAISSLLALSGCNLIFNNGSESEVPGVYGVNSFFYRDKNTVTHNFADQYEYYLLVLYKGDTGKVIYKPADGDEQSYDVTYTMIKNDTDNANKVTSVKVSGFIAPDYTLDNDGNVVKNTVTDADFEFKPVSEVLMYRQSSIIRITENGNNAYRTVVNRIDFKKIFDKTTDAKIERAKQKQTDTREERSSADDSDQAS